MFKVNNRNTRIRCEICLKLTIKTPATFSVVLVSSLLTLNMSLTSYSSVSTVNYEKVNAGWDVDALHTLMCICFLVHGVLLVWFVLIFFDVIFCIPVAITTI